MSSKLVVGPINKGLRNDRLPFNIDNDSFPNLINAYEWRGRIKRKRGTTLLGRLTRYFDSTSSAYTGITLNPFFHITFDGAGNANLIGPYSNATPVSFSLQANATFVPGTITIVGSNGPITYTDPTMDGYLTPTGTDGPNTIDYSTGAIHIPAQAGGTATVQFNYFPDLPVMGLEDFILPNSQFPGNIAFDTTYSYNINDTSPFTIFSTSFYKNPSPSASMPGYVAKTVWTPVNWNGQDYQQFWTTNYQGALWATNGINIPFIEPPPTLGMQYKLVGLNGAVRLNATDVTFTTTTIHPFVIGDFVFANEFTGINGLNFETGYVIGMPFGPNPTPTMFTARFPTATISGGPGSNGIVQALTTSCQPDTNGYDGTKDCIRFYDGSPVTSNTPPVFVNDFGWVNFAPPLSLAFYSIAGLPAAQYYLVGARAIVPFKDRLLFFGPVVQSSAVGSQEYLQDTVIYSQNGTTYYTTSFPYSANPLTIDILVAATFTPLIVPDDETAQPQAFFEDADGFGGFSQAGLDQAITTVSSNEDVLIVGFTNKQTRFVYTGDDLIPFLFYIINSEYGSSSTFSTINFDRAVATIGPNGIIMTSQPSAERLDLEIPDQVFQFNLLNNGIQRVTAVRDFINEWVYFTYSPQDAIDYFPGQTLLYNYREKSWAIFNESYTTYGTFRKLSGQNWDDLTDFTWDEWNDPWDSGEQTLAQPEIIAGNQQGFIMIRDEGTGEDPSGYIQNIDSSSAVTSVHHNLNDGDFIIITGALGSIGNSVNGKIFSVTSPSANTFFLNPTIPPGTYFGNGVFTRMYIPLIQTKQFPVSWDMGRKTRIGAQRYLLTETSLGQITLLIFLSQNANSAYNIGPIVPNPLSTNNSLIYSTVLYTCPESTNLGLTPANVNLQMPTASEQAQIWHRINTSLIGDTVQLGFTLSEEQMRTLSPTSNILLISNVTQANPAVVTVNNGFVVGQLVEIDSVVGMTQLNGNVYIITAVTPTAITIGVDSTGFTAYSSGGTVNSVGPIIQFDEIELHGFIIDISPSQMLA